MNKKPKHLFAFLSISGVFILLALLFCVQLVQTAGAADAPDSYQPYAGSANNNRSVLAKTPTKTPRGTNKKTPTPKKTAKPTIYPTRRPSTATLAPAATLSQQETVTNTETIPIQEATAAPAPAIPESVNLQICLQGACNDFPVEVYCDEAGACDGNTTIPSANCGASEDCEAAVKIDCVPSDNNVSQCSGAVNLTPCGGLTSCDPALKFTCSASECNANLPIYMPAGGPTHTPAAPTAKPGLLSGFTGFPWGLFLICFVIILIGLAVGVFILWRMSSRQEEDEDETDESETFESIESNE